MAGVAHHPASRARPADPGFAALEDGFAAAGGAVRRYFDSGTWYEDSQGMDFQHHLAARPTNLRNTHKRKSQKLGAQGEFVFHGDAARIEDGVADYEKVYRTSWKGSEPFPDFMPQLIHETAKIGALRLGILKIGGEAAAAHCWIVWQGRATIYKLAHDGRFDTASPGLF